MPYLTPDEPTSDVVLQFTVPNTLMPSVVGALASLWNPHHWEKYGALEIPDTLEYVGDIITSIVEDPPVGGTTVFKGVRVEAAGPTVVPNLSWDAIPFTTEVIDQGDFFDSGGAANHLDIPTGLGGYYMLHCELSVQSAGSAGTMEIQLVGLASGALEIAGNISSTVGETTFIQLTSIVLSAQNEGISLLLPQNTGNDVNVYNLVLWASFLGT